MLFHNINYLAKNYDMIWIGVEESLRTKRYWERIGFIKLFEIPEAFFYMIPFNEKLLN
jgi:hypothetical protein